MNPLARPPVDRMASLPMLALAGLVLCFAAAGRAADPEPARGPMPSGLVHVFAIHNHPDLAAPWQKMRPHSVTGSGAIISEKRVLTNAHVVEDAGMLEVQTEGSSRRFTAELVFVSHELDLAILRVADPAFFEGTKALEVGDLPAIQSHVSVYGFPEGGSAASVTSGVVSRLEVERYVHSYEYFLRGQIDAAINPGNSGGPVVGKDGKIVGIAMQVMNQAQSIGYMVPAPVIKHFLKDVADGKHDGVPDLGIALEPLENPSLRKSLGLEHEKGGGMVVLVEHGSAADGVLEVGDVVVAYDGVPIDQECQIPLKDGLRVNSAYIEESKQVGEPIEVTFLRGGERKTVKIKSTVTPHMLRTREEDGHPRYYVYGGLVFQPLSSQYVRSYRRPPAYPYLFEEEFTTGSRRTLVAPHGQNERDEIVMITGVLSDDVNRGYAWAENSTVYSVDGQVVRNFDALVKEIETGTDPYVRFVTDSGILIALERSAVTASRASLLARYGLTTDRSSDVPASPELPSSAQ
jgi:S1-C subfamily serine protease